MDSLKMTCLLVLTTVVLQSRPLDGAVFSVADLMAIPDGTTPSPVDIPAEPTPSVPEVITPAPEVKPPTPAVETAPAADNPVPPAPQQLPVPASVLLTLLTSSRRSVRGLAVANDKLFVLSVGQSTGPVIEVYSDSVSTLNAPVQQFRLADVTPRDLAVSADGTRLYVADERSRAVLVFDAANGARLSESWKLQCTPDTLSVTGDVLAATCGDNLVRLCFHDGSVKTSSISSELNGVDHVVQLGNGQLAALVHFKATNKDAICVGNTQQGFSTSNCYQSGLNSPVYLAPVYGGYVLAVDRAAEGTLRIYGPGLESGLSVPVPAGFRGLPGVRRVVVDFSHKLVVVAYSSSLAVFTATIAN